MDGDREWVEKYFLFSFFFGFFVVKFDVEWEFFLTWVVYAQVNINNDCLLSFFVFGTSKKKVTSLWFCVENSKNKN